MGPTAEQLAQRAVVRLAFYFPSEDATVIRDFNMADVEAQTVPDAFRPNQMTGPPDWLLEAFRSWDHPQDPVTFSGIVDEDREVEGWATLTEYLPPPDEDRRADAFKGWMKEEGIDATDLDAVDADGIVGGEGVASG